MARKIVILSFDSAEKIEIEAFIRRIRVRAEVKGEEIEDEDIHVIYPADVSNGNYMTWTDIEPSEEEKEILDSLTSKDKLYIWAHGSPNYGYIPGAYYTEIANYLEKSITKENFSPTTGPLNIAVEICSGGRGGPEGKDSFAAKLHSYLKKLGVFSSVSARIKNLAIDMQNIQDKGLSTLSREYNGLNSIGIPIPDSLYKHQSPRSKVVYMWDPSNLVDQIRVDSYRRALLIDFLYLKREILEKINDKSARVLYPRAFHQLFLTIEMNLADDSRPLNVNLIRKTTEKLYDECIRIGFSEEILKELEFKHFQEAIDRKAHSDGFVRKKTGNKSTDAKFPIEEKSILDCIADHPTFKALDEAINQLSDIASQDENLKRLIELIGSKATFGQDNLYADLFMIARKHIMILNNGEVTLPPEIDTIFQPIIKALKTIYLDNNKSLEEKKETILELKNALSYYTPSQIQKLRSNVNGVIHGLKIGYAERHEASIFEVVPNLFYSSYTFANSQGANYESLCVRISDTIMEFEKKVSITEQNTSKTQSQLFKKEESKTKDSKFDKPISIHIRYGDLSIFLEELEQYQDKFKNKTSLDEVFYYTKIIDSDGSELVEIKVPETISKKMYLHFFPLTDLIHTQFLTEKLLEDINPAIEEARERVGNIDIKEKLFQLVEEEGTVKENNTDKDEMMSLFTLNKKSAPVKKESVKKETPYKQSRSLLISSLNKNIFQNEGKEEENTEKKSSDPDGLTKSP